MPSSESQRIQFERKPKNRRVDINRLNPAYRDLYNRCTSLVTFNAASYDGRVHDLSRWGGNIPWAYGGTFATPGSGNDRFAFAGNSSNYVDSTITDFPDPNVGGLFCDTNHRFTVVCRFTGNGNGTAFAKAGATTASRTFQLWFSGGTFRTNIRGSQSNIAGWPIGDGASHCAVVTWDGTTAIIYGDRFTYTGALLVGSAAEETTQRFIIGARTNGTGYLLPSGGYVHDVAVFNKVLGEGQIGLIFKDFEGLYRQDNYPRKVFVPVGGGFTAYPYGQQHLDRQFSGMAAAKLGGVLQ